jgi:hypothetical protein
MVDMVKTMSPRAECKARLKDGYSSTVFVLMSRDSTLYIATTTHNLDHLFKASDPLEGYTMDMFKVSFLCHHFEQDYQQHGFPGERKYVNGMSTTNRPSRGGTFRIAVLYCLTRIICDKLDKWMEILRMFGCIL